MVIRIGIGLGALLLASVAHSQELERQNIGQQSMPSCPPICVGQGMPIPQPGVYPNYGPYGQYGMYQGAYGGAYPGAGAGGGYGQPGSSFVVGPDGRLYPSQQMGGQQGPGQAGVSGLDQNGQSPSSNQRPPIVDPSVYQRGQSPHPGDGGSVSVLNQGGKYGGIKNTLLRQQGRREGIQDGYAEFVDRINLTLYRKEAGYLEQRYNFGALMIAPGVAPPVITEVTRGIEKRSDRYLILTLGAFEIVRPARLVTVTPSWRDYLVLKVPVGAAGANVARSNGPAEKKVYDAAYHDGRIIGGQEARAAFEDAMGRLRRDYDGMKRYQELARTGAISVPVVGTSKERFKITNGGKRAIVGEKTVRLVVNSKFKAKPGSYPTVATKLGKADPGLF